jgi:hypothetical protein
MEETNDRQVECIEKKGLVEEANDRQVECIE